MILTEYGKLTQSSELIKPVSEITHKFNFHNVLKTFIHKNYIN